MFLLLSHFNFTPKTTHFLYLLLISTEQQQQQQNQFVVNSIKTHFHRGLSFLFPPWTASIIVIFWVHRLVRMFEGLSLSECFCWEAAASVCDYPKLHLLWNEHRGKKVWMSIFKTCLWKSPQGSSSGWGRGWCFSSPQKNQTKQKTINDSCWAGVMMICLFLVLAYRLLEDDSILWKYKLAQLRGSLLGFISEAVVSVNHVHQRFMGTEIWQRVSDTIVQTYFSGFHIGLSLRAGSC